MNKRLIILTASFFFFPLSYGLFFGVLPTALSMRDVFGAAVFTLSVLLFVVGALLLVVDVALILIDISKIISISYSHLPGTKNSHRISIKFDITSVKNFVPIRKGGHLSRLSHK